MILYLENSWHRGGHIVEVIWRMHIMLTL